MMGVLQHFISILLQSTFNFIVAWNEHLTFLKYSCSCVSLLNALGAAVVRLAELGWMFNCAICSSRVIA